MNRFSDRSSILLVSTIDFHVQIKEGFCVTQSFNQAVKNIKGSFAVEGMNLSKQSLHNLERLSKGNVSITELVKEISERYKVKGK